MSSEGAANDVVAEVERRLQEHGYSRLAESRTFDTVPAQVWQANLQGSLIGTTQSVCFIERVAPDSRSLEDYLQRCFLLACMNVQPPRGIRSLVYSGFRCSALAVVDDLAPRVADHIQRMRLRIGISDKAAIGVRAADGSSVSHELNTFRGVAMLSVYDVCRGEIVFPNRRIWGSGLHRELRREARKLFAR